MHQQQATILYHRQLEYMVVTSKEVHLLEVIQLAEHRLEVHQRLDLA